MYSFIFNFKNIAELLSLIPETSDVILSLGYFLWQLVDLWGIYARFWENMAESWQLII